MILVTGGLGFIGSHIALSLMAQGQEVVIVDNLSNANMQILQRLEYSSAMFVPFVKVDIRNTPALNKVFEQYSIDAVVHCAGFKSLHESALKPLEYYNDNVSCIMSLLRSMQRTGVRNFVHLSSLAVYGTSSTSLDETTPIQYNYPNPYVRSQQMIEQIIQDTFATDNEWKIAILRLGNIAGAFGNGVLGEIVAPLPKNILPLALQVAAEQRDIVELRQDAPTSDHTVERSFLHVMDASRAVIASLKWLFEQHNVCEAFDIAGEVVSMQTLIEQVAEVTQKSVPVHASLANDQVEIAQLGSQSLKAKEILGWEAQYDLEKMIQDQWQFYQNVLNGQ
jgi:UDP-glucose 4-epimerase